ncbi:MAG: hypothetical protein JW795_23260, partial [Chitinivibrionales bacterium]|nr:hypothetical protein [Chitinivibrionales bacterium]
TEDNGEGTGVRVNLERFTTDLITEDNPEMVKTYTDGSIKGYYEHVLCNAGETYNYLIITSKEIIDAKTNPNINDLLAYRKAQGLTCKVQDIASVLRSYSGTAGSDKLRNFIKDAYNNWKIKWVVLGGDIDIIPLKTIRVSANSMTDDLPTDLTYQCLDGTTWSSDYKAEVFIGRISAENAEEFGNSVYKILSYEKDPPTESYKKCALGVGEKLADSPLTWGGETVQAVERSVKGFSFDHLFEKDGAWEVADIVAKINTSKYAVVNHMGHSRYCYVMKMASARFISSKGSPIEQNWKPSDLTNTKFSFAYSEGCIPGAFDSACIAEELTTSNRTGCWGVVFNSNYGWFMAGQPTGGGSYRFHNAFWSGYSNNGLKSVGEANEYSHQSLSSGAGSGETKWILLETNLFGDPYVQFLGQPVNPTKIADTKSLQKTDHIKLSVLKNPALMADREVTITYNLTKCSRAFIFVCDPLGSSVLQQPLSVSATQMKWNLRSDKGRLVSAGTYRVIIKYEIAGNVQYSRINVGIKE